MTPAEQQRAARARAQIVRATERVGKTYRFDEQHDPRQPVGLFFQQTHEGEVLFVIFYTLACRYSACLGCNLPATASLTHVGYEALMAQIDHVFARDDVRARAPQITRLIVSNQGSVLDEVTFSSTALLYLVAQANRHLPRLSLLCLETRPEYIDECEVEFLARAIREAHDPEATVELAIGFEAFDDEIRNRIFNKGLTLGGLERVVALVARHHFRLKTYFMQKPVPGLSDEAAIADVQGAIDYLAGLARDYDARIGLHLNPTYVARGTPLEQAFRAGEFTPPMLRDVARAALHARDKPLSVYLGIYDEGLAVDGGSFVRPGDEALLAELQRFNATQDYNLLARLTRG